jgi:hypothetical protein
MGPGNASSDGLHLAAEDGDDLSILSGAVQDAVFKVRDLTYDGRARRFSLLLNRFRWEKAGKRGPFTRVRAGLTFDSVTSVQVRKVRRDAPEAVGSLLSIGFAPGADPPGGIILLHLAGGGLIRLEVECVDVRLIDIGTLWITDRKPDHSSP